MKSHLVPQDGSPANTSTIALSVSDQSEVPEWLRELYPYRTGTLPIGGYRLSTVDEAPAETAPGIPTFVLLHGNYTWSFLFRDLIGRLQQTCRVVAPDMIGFGLSEKPDAEAYHTLQQHVSNFTCLVDALELRDITLVLHGWGGPIGLAYACAQPQNVKALVLTNTWAGIPPAIKTSRQPLGSRIAEWGRVGRRLDDWFNLSLHSAFAARSHRPVRDMALEAYSYPFHHHASRAAIRAWSRMFAQPDEETLNALKGVETGLSRITAPVDLLYGSEDSLLSKLPAYMLRDSLKHAKEPVFLNETGHFLPEEAPEALADFVLRTQQRGRPKHEKERMFRILP